MQKADIQDLLKGYDEQQVETYANYVFSLILKKDKQGKDVNPWAKKMTPEKWASLFKKVASEGLVLDGKNITIDIRGISYNWVAFKNKMLLAYPDSVIDIQLVYTDDEFEFSKQSGSINYEHKIKNPFKQKDEDVIGAYCVIKNKRGEFLTTLSREDIMKHREVAKTKNIWDNWFKEMAMKTIIKKACSQHFRDIYQSIEDEDNERYDLDLLDQKKADDLLSNAKQNG